jgi:hypothetical protein
MTSSIIIVVAIFGDRTRQVTACASDKEIKRFLSGAGRTTGSYLQPQPLGEGREVYRETVEFDTPEQLRQFLFEALERAPRSPA